jgi:uncharacterized membrane protein YjjB (DUF3815 family)
VNVSTILMDGLWGGLLSLAMAAVFASPYQALLPSFCCGFIARGVRDALVGRGVGQVLAIAIAAALVVMTAVVLVRRSGVSPIVMVSGLIPLGAAAPFFSAIVDFLQISSRRGDALDPVPLKLVLDLSKVFTTFLAIAVGGGLGFELARIFRSEATQ